MRFAGDSLTESGLDVDIARLPGGEQGPVRGVHTPIKNYGGKYMPDGSAGSGGYAPGPVRQASIDGQELALGGVGTAALVIGGLSALKRAEMGMTGGAVNPGTIDDYANQDPTNKYNRHKQDADKNYMDIMKSGFI